MKIKIAEFTSNSSTTLSGAGTYYSDPPYELAAWDKGIILGYVYGWSATTDTLVATVQWGVVKEGEFPYEDIGTPANSTLIWVDSTNTVTLNPTSVSDKLILHMPITMESPYMKIKLALLGAGTPTAQMHVYFYGY